jgi:hypothetical protein
MPPESLQNNDFEGATLDPWTAVNAQQTTVRAYSGTKSVTRVAAGAFSVEQDISSLNLRFDQLLELSAYCYNEASGTETMQLTITVTFTDATTYTKQFTSDVINNWVQFKDTSPGLNQANASKIVQKIKFEGDSNMDNIDLVSAPYAWIGEIVPTAAETSPATDPRGGNSSSVQSSSEFLFADTSPIARTYGGVWEVVLETRRSVIGNTIPREAVRTSITLFELEENDIVGNVIPSSGEHAGKEPAPVEGWYDWNTKTTLSGYLKDKVGDKKLPYYEIAMKMLGEGYITRTNEEGVYVAFLPPKVQDLSGLDAFAYSVGKFKAYMTTPNIVKMTTLDSRRIFKQVDLIGTLFLSRLIAYGIPLEKIYGWRVE